MTTTATRRIDRSFLVLGVAWLVLLGWLFWITPEGRDGGIGWTVPMAQQGWMAWVLPTALFFMFIAALLLLFSYICLRFPETPSRGILGIETTRGDRLFISLLGSAWINLAWLGLIGAQQWMALIVCLIFAAAVFRWV